MEVSRRAVIGAAGAVGTAGVLLPHLPGHHAAWAMGAPFPTDDPHLQHGHAPVWDELTVEDLPVRGEIPRDPDHATPADLHGSLRGLEAARLASVPAGL